MTATDQAVTAGTAVEEVPRLRLALADYFTLGNALCGFMAVWQLATAQVAHISAGLDGPLQRNAVAVSVILLLVAAACDLFDGRVARKLGGSGMGAELDNLADVISFGFAPAFFVVAWGTFIVQGNPVLPTIAAAAVLLAVVVRLARFSCQAPGEHTFSGLPSPFGAMTVIVIVLLNPPVYLGVASILLVAWLMVSQVKYPKPRGRVAYAVLAAILAGVGCLAAWAMDAPAGEVLLYSGSGLMLLVILLAPVHLMVDRHQNR
ncbi:CDP-alcohol phosphatidyltransferase family protein [Actinorugispora endophytica]|uniref:CDP-diacylglycerol--serine O-phosphatidyltransferase n=1 Tax=Actinorugispora endophytica TaxID=1605990 RepID=A0A4R6UUN1_9ACTN|nr:CDP-alcohol phosphatidyltransferase family protein [Actinorugispora endophytica]TDQ49619.1 CDP-diacylglycerol--serine O-phosphatidyltransferase [Actinorugispora endophytica]